MTWTIIWVAVVTLIFVALVRWGSRTTRQNGVVAIAAAALFWAFVRLAWIDFQWFLYRPLGGWGYFWVFVFFALCLVLAIGMKRDPKILGWVAVLIAVLAPFGDLFSGGLWSDLWPANWALPGSVSIWSLAWFLLIVGIVVLFIKGLRPLGAIAVAVTLLVFGLAMMGVRPGSDKDPVEVATETTDVCVTFDGSADDEAQTEVPDGFEVDETGNCTAMETESAVDPTACPARYVQHLDPNEQFRFVSDGFKGTPAEKRQQLVKATAHDYRYLVFVGEQLFKRDIDEDKMVTAGGECLSSSGRALHTQVMGALMASSVRTGLAPADDYNTGMENGQPVVSRTRGIYGDRKATIYTLADGTKLIVLDRCGNISVPAPPKGTPPGKTDNPKPPKPPETPDTPDDNGGCVEIPGNGVFDCGSKDPSQEPAQQGNIPDQVQGQAPGVGNDPATPPATTHGGGGSSGGDPGGGSGGGGTPPPQEPDTPTPDDPEPSPTVDPCQANPDFCE